MYIIISIVFIIIVALIIAFYWGKATAQRQTSLRIAKEKSEDAKVATYPYVDDPINSMRRKN